MKRVAVKAPSTSKKTVDRVERARRALLGKRAQLLNRRQRLLSDEVELKAEPEADWEDVAAVKTTTDMIDTLSDIELAELERITRALQRIEAGTYGRCQTCNEPIADGRLAVMPEALTCADCAE